MFSWTFVKSCVLELLVNPKSTRIIAFLLFVFEVVLNIFIVKRVKCKYLCSLLWIFWIKFSRSADTEIDWTTYMQQVECFLNGTRDYTKITGDTGPIVYPSGHLLIYSTLFYVTNSGKNILFAQYIFIGLYLLNLLLVFRMYHKFSKVSSWVRLPNEQIDQSLKNLLGWWFQNFEFNIYFFRFLHLLSVWCASLRIVYTPFIPFDYSMIQLPCAFSMGPWISSLIIAGGLPLSFSGIEIIYSINQCDRCWLFGKRLTNITLIRYSLAVSVKMNILLFAPGLLLLFLENLSLIDTMKNLSICALVQV